MITLRVDEKALMEVLTLAKSTEDLDGVERKAVVHVATQAAKACQEALSADDIEGAPIP